MSEGKSKFEPLMLPQKKSAFEGNYRIYSDRANYKIVQAATALEALEKLGIKNAYKIERESLSSTNVLKLAPEKTAVVEIIAEEKAPEILPAAEVPATTDEPLSTEDIDKLLQPQ